MSRHVIATEKGNHHNCAEANGHPGHSDATRILYFFGVLDGHKAHEDVRHAKVAKSPRKARNQRDKPNGLARRCVREKAHQVRILGVHGVNRRGKTARAAHDYQRNHKHRDKHHQRLDKVRPAYGKESAQERVAHHHDRTKDKSRRIAHAENRSEQLSAGDKAGDRVEQEERENENRGNDADDSLLVAETIREKVRERNRVAAEMAVLAQPATDDFPVEVRADYKPNANPGFGKAAHEHGARESHQQPAAHI